MCALRILTGRPGALLESRRQKPTTTKELSSYMIFLVILFGHRQHVGHADSTRRFVQVQLGRSQAARQTQASRQPQAARWAKVYIYVFFSGR
jgi:hypothetical protein